MEKQNAKTLNPALVLGIGLLPLIWVTLGIKSALIFSVLVFSAMVLSQLLVGAFRLVISHRVRFVCYALCVIAIVYFLDSFISELMPKSYGDVHGLIVLLFASSIIFYNLEQTRKVKFGVGLKNTLIIGGLYALSIVAVGAIREILCSGSLWEMVLVEGFDGIAFFGTLPGALLIIMVFTLIYNSVAQLLLKRRRVYDTLVERYEAVLDENIKVDDLIESKQNDTQKPVDGGK